tara:strand:- start:592 stop:1512 length:921 start_codon:yes stop_codon:yes gene_type:complete
MRIENSPFHISKNKVSPVKENAGLKNQHLLNDKKVNELGKDDFSFWDWFRGLVNPLQNLPIISGIYSSMNSEDSKSDRDLIQNSLGGFMYGGPIGAIAGFGNWIFNKIFDKTPSELALDATGISNLWKDDNKNKSQIAENNKIDDNKNSSLVISNDNYGEWWKGDQKQGLKNYVASSKNNFESTKKSNFKNISIENKNQLIERNINKYATKPAVLENKQNISLAFDSNSELVKINNQISESINDNNENKEFKKEKFNEINFNYPNWSPNSSQVDKNKNDLKSKDLINKKYMDLKDRITGSNFNLKL